MRRAQNSAVAPTALEASLVRAVEVGTVLRGCGSCFSSQAALDVNYQQSFEANQIGDFLSHDWASSRLEKWLGLCLVYNSPAALVASLVTAYVLAALQYGADPLLPVPLPSICGDTRYWCHLCCPLVFAFFFLFWQDVRWLLCKKPRSCFLDKFCIDQANPDRKAAGILGLAGFLRCSDWFVVLWTPRYFTRLWCTYEVASWLHLQKPLNSVLLMPLEHAKTIMTLAFGICCGFLGVHLCVMFFPDLQELAVPFGCFVPLTFGAHQARRSAHHLRALTEQLANFSVTSSSCHCCTTKHRTSSGEKIPCDREVVYATIADWFGGDDDMEVSLDRFDQAVRNQFAPKVLEKAGPMQLSYRYTVVVGWPFLFRGCDVLAASEQRPQVYKLNTFVMYPTLALVAVPAWYKLAMYMAHALEMWVGIPSDQFVDILWTIALGVTYSMIVLMSWYCLEVLTFIGADWWLMILAASGIATAAAGLYIQDLRELVGRAVGQDLQDFIRLSSVEKTSSTGMNMEERFPDLEGFSSRDFNNSHEFNSHEFNSREFNSREINTRDKSCDSEDSNEPQHCAGLDSAPLGCVEPDLQRLSVLVDCDRDASWQPRCQSAWARRLQASDGVAS